MKRLAGSALKRLPGPAVKRLAGPALKRLAKPLDSVLGPLDTLRQLETGGGIGAIATAQAALARLTSAATTAGAPPR